MRVEVVVEMLRLFHFVDLVHQIDRCLLRCFLMDLTQILLVGQLKIVPALVRTL